MTITLLENFLAIFQNYNLLHYAINNKLESIHYN
jgi:hypothetical protein